MELGHKLKEARIKADLKQEELAQQIGVSRQTVSNWENGRTLPDLGSAVKLSDLYGISLDEMLKDEDLRTQLEKKQQQRKKWCLWIMDLAIVGGALGLMLDSQGLHGIGTVIAMLSVIGSWGSVLASLYLFDHSKKECAMALTALAIIGFRAVANDVFPLVSSVRRTALGLIPAILLYSSHVWRDFWNRRTFWVGAALAVAIPLLGLGMTMADNGDLNPSSPFYGTTYRVEEVLYPQGVEVSPAAQVTLYSHTSYIKMGEDSIRLTGDFSYLKPSAGQTSKGTWQLIPEEAEQSLYRVTVEADDSIIFSYFLQDQLQYKWKLTPMETASFTLITTGQSIHGSITWYAPGEEDPVPNLRTGTGVVGSAKFSLGITGEGTDPLTIQEEYHHGDSAEYAQLTLHPNEKGGYEMELTTRYDGVEEWVLYRIPCREGEFRLVIRMQPGAKEAFRQLFEE